MPKRWQALMELYATRNDYEPVIKAVEAERVIKYILTGVFDSPLPPTFYSGLDIPDLGIASTGVAVQERNYLVLDIADEVKGREIHLNQGGVRYSVSQMENPTTITFLPGGKFEECCLIKGDIGTVSHDPASITLYKAFVREFQKRFTCINDYWLGPEALQHLKAGMRLTDNVRSSVQYDLKSEPLALQP